MRRIRTIEVSRALVNLKKTKPRTLSPRKFIKIFVILLVLIGLGFIGYKGLTTLKDFNSIPDRQIDTSQDRDIVLPPEETPPSPPPVSDSSQDDEPEIFSLTPILLVPKDQDGYDLTKYKNGITASLEETQDFFRQKLDGKTFDINFPLQEVKAKKDLWWFYGCTSSSGCLIDNDDFRHSREGYLWDRTVEYLRSVGTPAFEEETFFAVFLLPGNHEYGTGSGFGLDPTNPGDKGMSILGDWKTAYASGFDPPTDPDPSRCHGENSYCSKDPALGAFIHEIGHSLGLAHPTDIQDQNASIMWSWWKYPNIGLTQSEKDSLLKIPPIR